jgi:hypothetical protein
VLVAGETAMLAALLQQRTASTKLPSPPSP